MEKICNIDLINLTIISHVPGCDYKFGLFPKADGCQTSYIKCEHGTPTEVGQQIHNTSSDLTVAQMQCEAENPNVPVVLGLAYDPDLHSCDWPDLLTDRGCDPAERLGDFQCPSLTGQQIYKLFTKNPLPGFGTG